MTIDRPARREPLRERARLTVRPSLVKRNAQGHCREIMVDGDKLTREERLATKLRENLRRRKAQSREMAAQKPSLSKASLSKEGEQS